MAPLDDCIQRYEQVTTALAETHRELAMVLIAESEARTSTWAQVDSQSPTVRDRMAAHAAQAFTSDKFKLQGEMAALEAERQYLDVRLAHG